MAIHDNIAVLLLFFVVHLIIGFVLITRTGRKLWLWTIMESAASDIARRLNRDGRSDSDRIVRGAAVFIVMTGMAYGAGCLWALMSAGNWGWAADFLLLSGALSAMTPVAVMRGTAKRLSEHKEERARAIVAAHVAEDLRQADAHAIARKAVEYGMESLCLLLVGPSLAYVFFGAAGVFVYVAVMAQQRIYGRAVPAQIQFGATVRAAERLLNLLPAAISAVLIALAAGVVSRGKPVQALSLPLRQAKGGDSFNRALVVSAAAGGLGLTLGGPRRWPDGQASPAAWLGAGGESARIEVAGLRRAGMLGFVAFLIFVLGFSGAFMMRI